LLLHALLLFSCADVLPRIGFGKGDINETVESYIFCKDSSYYTHAL